MSNSTKFGVNIKNCPWSIPEIRDEDNERAAAKAFVEEHNADGKCEQCSEIADVQVQDLYSRQSMLVRVEIRQVVTCEFEVVSMSPITDGPA